MNDEEDYKLKPFIFEDDIDTVLEFHKDHVMINFPDSMYKEDLFKKQVRTAYDEGKDELIMVKHPLTNESVGFLWFKRIYDPYKELNYGDLHYIHLVPKMRGRGIGKKLMVFAEEWFKEHNCKEIRLGTDEHNLSSRYLYQKCGFVVKRVIYEKKI